jgi:hypothetical protein
MWETLQLIMFFYPGIAINIKIIVHIVENVTYLLIGKQLGFLTQVKIRHFWGTVCLVKDSRQFKQREKRLLKVVTV